MKAKFGAIVVDGRGKIGGHVMSKNRAGAYMRTKVTPVNPNTSFQASVRNRLASISSAWRGLTQVQRDAWNQAVNEFKRTDIFGDIKNPSGINLYQRLNNILSNVGGSALTTPPLPVSVSTFSALSVVVVTGTPAITLTYAPAIPATEKVMVFGTAPQSAGKSFVKSEFRLIGVYDSADTSPLALVSDYVAKFGSVGVTGKKLFFRAIHCNSTSGQAGIAQECHAISTAS
jgi:hypothetical protein